MNSIQATPDFNQQVLETSPQLKPYAIKLTRNFEDANDLLQDTLARAFINKSKFRDGTNLRAWLYAIMRNTFINNYRRDRKFNNVGNTLKRELFVNNVAGQSYEHGYSRVLFKALRAEIENLSWVYRIPFELHINGYKYKEIADLLHLPMNEVKSNIHMARKKLKKTLSN